ASLGTASEERDTAKSQLDAAQAESARLGADVAALTDLKQQLEREIAALSTQLDTSKKDLVAATDLNAKSAAQVELLNRQLAAVRDQLNKLSAALDLANAGIKDKDATIADLGAQLNLALANKVNQ